MKLKAVRDKIAWFVASKEGKKNLTEGVTDDNFYDYGAYVNLIAKSLRRMANDRQAYTVMNWRMPEIWEHLSQEDMAAYAEKETKLLNKWADILEIDLDVEEPYYKEFNDHLEGMRTEGLQIVFPEHTEESKKKQDDFNDHEMAILNLKSDILSELGANFMYMWD